MRPQTIDGSSFIDKKGVMRVSCVTDKIIQIYQPAILSRLVVEQCRKVYLSFNKMVDIVNKKDIIPVIITDNEDFIVYDLNILNISPTVSMLMRSSGSIRRCRIVGGTTGIHVDHNDVFINENKLYRQTSDGVFVSGQNFVTVDSNTIQISGSDALKGIHPDAIQLAGKETFEYIQTNMVVVNNYIKYGDHPDCQGIVHSDGMLVDSYIQENDVDSRNDNGIRVNRANSCSITDNSVTSSIYIGSQKKVDLESNSNKITGNVTGNLYTYNVGDTIVKENIIRGKYLSFDSGGNVSTGVQSVE